jgi:hypothetical protein
MARESAFAPTKLSHYRPEVPLSHYKSYEVIGDPLISAWAERAIHFTSTYDSLVKLPSVGVFILTGSI